MPSNLVRNEKSSLKSDWMYPLLFLYLNVQYICYFSFFIAIPASHQPNTTIFRVQSMWSSGSCILFGQSLVFICRNYSQVFKKCSHFSCVFARRSHFLSRRSVVSCASMAASSSLTRDGGTRHSSPSRKMSYSTRHLVSFMICIFFLFDG